MNRLLAASRRRLFVALLVASTTALAAPMVLAQSNDGPPAGFGGPAGFPGPPPMRGRPTKISLATVPVSLLASELKLTDDQRDQITTIQQRFRDIMRTADDNSDGQPIDRAAREQRATSAIKSLLTTTQRDSAAALITDLTAARNVGMSPQLFAALVLTADQRKALTAFAAAHPRPMPNFNRSFASNNGGPGGGQGGENNGPPNGGGQDGQFGPPPGGGPGGPEQGPDGTAGPPPPPPDGQQQ